MKKLHLLLSSIIVIFLFNSINVKAATSPQIAADKVNADSGMVVQVPITISDNSGICGGIIRVEYDEKIVLKSVTKGEALSKLNMTEPGDLAANPVNIGWDGVDEDDSNGVIAILSFEVPNYSGTYEISLSSDSGDIIDGNLTPVAPIFINGEITVGKKENDSTAVDEVVKLINEINNGDGKTVIAAREAYDLLTDEQKILVSAQDYKKLTDAEETIMKNDRDEKAVSEVVKLINELPKTISASDEEQVKKVIDAYNNLSPDQKEMINTETKKILTDAEKVLGEKGKNGTGIENTKVEESKEPQQKEDSSTTSINDKQSETIVNSVVKKPEKVKLKNAKNKANRAVKISWKKITVNGYEIQIALNKKFTKSKKTFTSTNTNITIKKLKKKKTYYIRVRAFNKDGDNKVYGSWSKIKKVKIKK